MNLNLRTKCIVLENIFTISNSSEQPQGFNYAREKLVHSIANIILKDLSNGLKR